MNEPMRKQNHHDRIHQSWVDSSSPGLGGSGKSKGHTQVHSPRRNDNWDDDPLTPEGFVCDSLSSISPVELTGSWLATNLYEGCSFGCLYCFRHRWNSLAAPMLACSVDEGLQLLLEHPRFRFDDTPLTVNVRSTDPLHPRVRSSTFQFMERLDSLGLRNPFGIVTKGFLSEPDAARIVALKTLRVMILVSYSGMPPQIEPMPTSRRRTSLRNARTLGIPTILSYKPIVAGWNDSETRIREVMRIATDDADAIVVGGLRMDAAIANHITSQGVKVPIEVPGTWGGKAMTPETLSRIHAARDALCPDVPLFAHTSCAVSYVTGMKNYNSLRKRAIQECTPSCPVTQIRLCDD